MTYEDLYGKDLITTQEWNRDELDMVLEVAKDLKRRRYSGETIPNLLPKKTFFSLFYNTSTRTRASFEAAMTLLGGHAQYIEASTTRLLQGEAMKDVARVYSRYGEGIGVRLNTLHEFLPGRATSAIRELAHFARIPVINMANGDFHPCQALTDMMTVQEKFPKYEKKKFVCMWAYSGKVRTPGSINGDALLMSRYGLDVVIASPPEFELDPKIISMCKHNSKEGGGSFDVTTNVSEALDGAHVVFPRGWSTNACILGGLQSSGGEAKELTVYEKYKNWRLTSELTELMDSSGKIMHVMPAYRGLEVDDEVLDSSRSIIIDQAENRLYSQMAVLSLTMGGK